MKFAFIAEHRREFPVIDLCRVLAASKSGFYRWIEEPVGKKAARRAPRGALRGDRAGPSRQPRRVRQPARLRRAAA